MPQQGPQITHEGATKLRELGFRHTTQPLKIKPKPIARENAQSPDISNEIQINISDQTHDSVTSPRRWSTPLSRKSIMEASSKQGTLSGSRTPTSPSTIDTQLSTRSLPPSPKTTVSYQSKSPRVRTRSGRVTKKPDWYNA